LKTYFYFLTGITLLCIASCSTADESELTSTAADKAIITTSSGNETVEETSEIYMESQVLTDVSYGNHPQQVYDLYLPAGRTVAKTKIITLIHGGGWVGGDKSNMTYFVDYLLENYPKYAILNLNYVLAQAPDYHAFPDQYINIDTAIHKIIEEQEELQIRPEFGLIGTSAGAHLAMMYDYTYDFIDDNVKFVIDIVGPTDFTDSFYTSNPDLSQQVDILVDKSKYPTDADYLTLNSPALLANSLSSPTLLFYGSDDTLVPLSNGESLNNSLNTQGIDNEFSIYLGGHGLSSWEEEDIDDFNLQMDILIKTYLPSN